VRRRIDIAPFHLLALITVFAAVFVAAGSLSDPDLYWHIPVGADIVHHHHITGAGREFSFTVDGRHWKTTQWLSEVGLYFVHAHWGFAGIRGLTIAVALAVVLLVFRAVRRECASLPVACLVFAVVAIPLAVHLEDRPATASLALLAAVAPYFFALLRGAPPRHTAGLAVFTWFWANVHGYWILVPASLVVLSVARIANAPRRDELRDSARPLIQALVTLVAGCLTPIGPAALTAVLRFHAATTIIGEWQPTSISDVASWSLLAVVGLLVVGWARGQERVSWGELVFAGTWMGFSLLAYRNTLPALIVLGPLAAARLQSVVRIPESARSEREKRALKVAAGVLAVGGLVAVTARVASTPTLPHTVPRHLIAVLATEPGEHRVLDDYNHSGQIILFGGSRTTVAVDGRADLYGSSYLHRYINMFTLTGDWQRTLAGIPANYALIKDKVALRVVLVERGWRVVARDRGLVLLAAPPPVPTPPN
jgi:hypothetical protein